MAEELFGGQDVGATPSYKEQAYRLIKEAILFNRFRVGAIYSQDDICKELGISRQHLAAIEAPNMNRGLSLELLFNIATVLEIEPYLLLKFSPEK